MTRTEFYLNALIIAFLFVAAIESLKSKYDSTVSIDVPMGKVLKLEVPNYVNLTNAIMQIKPGTTILLGAQTNGWKQP